MIGAGTAYEGLVDRGRLQAGQTVLITAAAGGAALPLEQARQALAQVAGGHTRGKVVLQIGP